MVVVPYELVWIMDRASFRPFHDELVEGVRVPFFLLPLLFSILVDLVRCGLSLWLVWCLLPF
jgi:hypothetical protein